MFWGGSFDVAFLACLSTLLRMKAKPAVDPYALLKQLAPEFKIAPEELEKELKALAIGTSIRLSLNNPREAKIAVVTVYLLKTRGYKKATFLKACACRGLPIFFEEQKGEAEAFRKFLSQSSSLLM